MTTTEPAYEPETVPLELVFETAAAHLSRHVPVADPEATVGAVLQRMQGQRFDSAADIAVCAGPRLVGVVPLEDLLAASPDLRVADLMDADPPVVGPGADQEAAAWKAIRHGQSSVAVVDETGNFLGLVPPKRMLEVLLAEHDEDIARLGGFLHSTASARHASEESVSRRLAHRLPWLLVGLAGAALAALVVGGFERRLSEDVTLAFFIPGIVYLADAVGTQTETLVVRGLSVGVPIGRVVRLEVVTGLVVGLSLAVAFLPVGGLLWGRADVVVAVAIALFAACSTATAVAMALPWSFQRFGRDPAFGSGPLATVIQDLLSLLIYFAVAAAIVG